MQYKELRFPESQDKVPYDARYYEALREDITASISDIQARNFAIHYSYCMQNLHLNYENKLKGILATYNSKHTLPHSFYFEPQSTSFPIKRDKQGNKLSDDGLRAYSLVFVHHADMYDMKSLPLTWNNLLQQYKQSFDFALKHGKINEWAQAGREGCFEGCVGELTDWYLKEKEALGIEDIHSLNNEEPSSQSQVTEYLDLEELMHRVPNLITNFNELTVEKALEAIKKVAKIKDREDFPDDEAILILSELFCLEFSDPQIQADFEARQREIKAQEKKITDYFIKARNQLKKPTPENAEAYLVALRTLLGSLRDDPEKLEILSQFDMVVKKYTQLSNLAISYEQSQSPDILDEYKRLEAEIQQDVSHLPTKMAGPPNEFSRSYCSVSGALPVLNNCLSEMQQKMQPHTQANAKIEPSIESLPPKNVLPAKTLNPSPSTKMTSSKKTESPTISSEHQPSASSVPEYDFKAKKNALADIFKPPVKPSTSSKQTDVSTPSTSDTDILQLQTNVQRLIHGNAIELPSHMSAQDLQDYLLGKKSIDEFIQKKGPQGTKRTAAVGKDVNPEEQQRLLSELQQAFNKRGLSSKEITPPKAELSSKQASAHPKKAAKSSQAASSSPVEPPSLESQDLTPDIVKKKLIALSNEGVIGINYPLEGDNGIIQFLFNKDVQLEKRKIDSKLKDPTLKAAIQPGHLVQNKEAFLAHAKQFGSVRNLLAETEKPTEITKEKETEVRRPKPIRHQKMEDMPSLSSESTAKQGTKPLKTIISNEKENISPNNAQPQNLAPQTVYGQSWQDFCSKLESINIDKKDGTITNNAYKKILGFIAKNSDEKSKTPTQEHQRLQELRDMLLGMHTVKNADLKDAIKTFIEDYKKLPPPLSRSLSIKRR